MSPPDLKRVWTKTATTEPGRICVRRGTQWLSEDITQNTEELGSKPPLSCWCLPLAKSKWNSENMESWWGQQSGEHSRASAHPRAAVWRIEHASRRCRSVGDRYVSRRHGPPCSLALCLWAGKKLSEPQCLHLQGDVGKVVYLDNCKVSLHLGLFGLIQCFQKIVEFSTK